MVSERRLGWKGEGEYDLKPSWSAAAEAGWRLKLSAGNHLYAGLFIDYGLERYQKRKATAPCSATNPTGLA